MKPLSSAFAIFLLTQISVFAGFWGFDGARLSFEYDVWKGALSGYDEASYREVVHCLMSDFENVTGKSLNPGVQGKVGLKIYTNSEKGLSTPKNLVRAVIQELVDRGFERHNIILVDLREDLLRDSGFLPALSDRSPVAHFEGSPVYVLDSGEYWDSEWFHDDPLPVPLSKTYEKLQSGNVLTDDSKENRKSYLPATLINDVDFFINLPMYTDDPSMGINGALANPTLWGVSNRERFLRSRTNAAPAIAEIAAIPELISNWAFTIATMERYQFIGGPLFNSLYTRQEPVVYLSCNPVILDAVVLGKINTARSDAGFKPFTETLPVLDYSMQLGVGSRYTQKIHWRTPCGSSNED